MCLLIVLAGVVPSAPLVVAANRDERLDRPATAMTILQTTTPRILGGRDELAGGTWLAVNEHGVVAGLTNRPSASGRDPTRRSRGELPMALASHTDAGSAAELAASWRPADYNAAWLMVGDRRSLYYIDLSGEAVAIQQLSAGIHILENRALGEDSPKVDRIRLLLEGVESLDGDLLINRLGEILRDHLTPGTPGDATPNQRPAGTEAACVHLDTYGTRSSVLVRLPAEERDSPWLAYTDGPPCTTDYAEASELWSGA
jgi:uncharacterized protein with NRDE domain